MRASFLVAASAPLLALAAFAACASPDAVPPTLIALAIAPADSVLVSIDGARPTQSFGVQATWSDGSTSLIADAVFDVAPPILGTIDPSGLFTASGRYGGDGRVQATALGQSASASIHIELERTIYTEGTSKTDEARFVDPPLVDPARAPLIVYPLDRAVMPQNVPPATVQWTGSTGGGPGDLFRVRLVKPSVEVTIYMLNDGPLFPDAYPIELASWRAIALSEPKIAAEITVDRYEVASGELFGSAPVHLRFAEAALEGAIYYRDATAGGIVRLDNRGVTENNFLPNPPLGCLGCHSVSRSGRYLAARLGADAQGAVFDLSSDLTSSSTAPTSLRTNLDWWYSTFSPDDRRLLITVNEINAGGMALFDLENGAPTMPREGALPTGRVSQPSWSPDGTSIAYLANLDQWGGLNTTADIYLLPVLGEDRFAAPLPLVRGSSLATEANPGASLSSPTWSPDSRLIAFAHGTSAESSTATGAIYLVDRNGGAPIRLDHALGGAEASASFQANFSPSHQGGYFWLCFLSRRDYGNGKIGTQGTHRRQIWVAAIKDTAMPGEDPSEVAYWLPGQDTRGINVESYWAKRACRAESEPCSDNGQCCSHACSVEAVCAAAPSTCRSFGESCFQNADCCDGSRCIDDTCGGS